MAKLFLFADEAGDFAFKDDGRASRFYIVGTVFLKDCQIGTELLTLRRRLAWEGKPLGDYFHASEDKQAIRDEVFSLISQSDIQIHATVMEKAKAQPHIRETNSRFYKYGTKKYY